MPYFRLSMRVKASGKSFGWSSQYGIIQMIFLLVFFSHLIHYLNGLVKSIPGFLAMTMALTVECHHGIVSSDKADS